MIEEILRLQKLNIEIDHIRSDAQTYPDQLQQTQKIYDTKKKKYEDLKNKIQALKAELGDMNTTYALEEQRLVKSRKKIGELTKSYELQAMKKEIDSTERSNVELAAQIKVKELDIEKIQKDFGQIEEDFQKAEAELLTIKTEVETKTGEFDGVISTKMQEVKKLEADCDRQILSKYNLIRTRKHQDAIVPIINGACQGCFMKIPPQMANMMLVRKEVIETCPNCQRLIFWHEATEK